MGLGYGNTFRGLPAANCGGAYLYCCGVDKMTPLEKRLEFLDDVGTQAKSSHKWMLETIKHQAEENNGDNFSPKLLHAISVQKCLEVI